MSIVGPLPSNIFNGDLVDAVPVMADFVWLMNQTNANACPATTATSVLKGDGFGGTTAAIPGTDYPTLPIQSQSVNFLQGGTGAQIRTVRAKLQEVSVNVMDFTASPSEWNTNISPAIQLAVNYVATNFGGGYVDFPANLGAGIMLSTISISRDDIKFRGQGHGGPHGPSATGIAATLLEWAGPTGGTMFSFQTPGASPTKIKGCGMTGIYLSAGLTVAAYGVFIATHDAGVWDVSGNGFQSTLMYMGCIASNGFLNDSYSNQQNIVTLRGQNILNAGGTLILDGRGDGGGNTNGNTFISIQSDSSTGTAIELLDCSNNLFESVIVNGFGVAGAEPTGYGLRMNGSNVSGTTCRGNQFLNVSASSNAVTSTWVNGVVGRGTEFFTFPSGTTAGLYQPNVILSYNWLVSQSLPFVGTNARLFFGTNRAPVGMQKRIQGVGAGHGLRVESDGWATQHGVDLVAGGSSTTIMLPHALVTTDASSVSVCPIANSVSFSVDSIITNSITINNGGGVGTYFWWKVEGYITLSTANWNF